MLCEDAGSPPRKRVSGPPTASTAGASSGKVAPKGQLSSRAAAGKASNTKAASQPEQGKDKDVAKPKHPAVSKGKPNAEAAQESADGRGRPTKFKGKSNIEVLESHGLVEVKRAQMDANLAGNDLGCVTSGYG